jgi:hypothetical protein
MNKFWSQRRRGATSAAEVRRHGLNDSIHCGMDYHSKKNYVWYNVAVGLVVNPTKFFFVFLSWRYDSWTNIPLPNYNNNNIAIKRLKTTSFTFVTAAIIKKKFFFCVDARRQAQAKARISLRRVDGQEWSLVKKYKRGFRQKQQQYFLMKNGWNGRTQ